MTRNTIKITVLEDGIKESVETSIGEYRNLMELLKDKIYLDSFGECGGMGRCATCIIKIEGLKGNALKMEKNEPVTLARFGYQNEPNIRLSCQIEVSADLDDVIIQILE